MPLERVYLGTVEELVLLTVRALGEGSAMDVARQFGLHNWESASCYKTLHRLERKRYVESRRREHQTKQAKAARMFAITERGLEALGEAEMARRRFGEAA